ncbi:MAG: GGDEF domain-containing protein [Solirubrobacterales bacterium]
MTDTATSERDHQRRYWRLAAILFIGGGIGAIPSDALHEPGHPSTIYLLPALAIVSGIVCWVIADHVSRRWLHLMTVIATLEVAITVWLADETFAIYYTFIAIFAAYVFRSRRAVALHVAFASLCALAPIVYEPDAARETLTQTMALIPTLLLAAGAVVFLRERLEASEERFRRLSERDPLTGAGNHRMLTDVLPRELSRHERHGHAMALVLLDLDDFKRVNDDHGHKFGDGVLQEVAATLMRAARESDVVVRHGGDEFAVIAPQTDSASALELARRLADALGEIEVRGRPLGACTGVAVYPADGEDVDELFATADAELLGSKQSKPLPFRGPVREQGEPAY